MGMFDRFKKSAVLLPAEVVVPRVVEQLGKSEFRHRFEAKGRYNQYLAAIPTFVITAQLPAFRGLKYVLGYR